MHHAQLLIIGAWLGLALVFTGVGAMFRRACGSATASADAWCDAFWIGWVCTLFGLQVWHCRRRIDAAALLATAAVGALGFAVNGRAPWAALARGVRSGWPLLVGAAVLVVWLSNRALGGPQNGDSGLYHIPTVRWLTQYPIVPGLGNLHGRLAFNQSYFLYVALLDVGPFTDRPAHLANGLLLAALFARVVLGLFRLLRVRRPCRLADLFYALCLPPATILAFNINLTSPSPDFPVFVLGLVLAGQLIALLDESFARMHVRLWEIMLLAAGGTTVKLSFAPLGWSVALVAAAACLRRAGRKIGEENPGGGAVLHPPRMIPEQGSCGVVEGGSSASALPPVRGAMISHTRNPHGAWQATAIAVVLAASGLLPWMLRGVILSGYPAYPNTFGGAPVEWRVPREAVIAEADFVNPWKALRAPWWRASLDVRWLGTWLRSLGWAEHGVLLPLAIAAGAWLWGAAGAVWRLLPAGENGGGGKRTLMAVLLPPLVAIGACFIMAPRPRFAGAAFWLLAIQSGMLACGRALCAARCGARLVAAVACVLLAGMPFFEGKSPWLPLRDFEGLPLPRVRPVQLDSGLVVQFAGETMSCWNAPLPCTPYTNQALRLRRAGDLGSGFVVDAPAGGPH